jgi:hypothetical protein
MLKRICIVNILVVVVVVIVENRTLVNRERTSTGVRKKEKGKEKYENNTTEEEKEEEKGRESRLTLSLCTAVLFIPSPWSVFDPLVTFVHFVRNEYRNQNISLWQSY